MTTSTDGLAAAKLGLRVPGGWLCGRILHPEMPGRRTPSITMSRTDAGARERFIWAPSGQCSRTAISTATLLDGAGPQDHLPDVAEVGIDEAVPLSGVPVCRGPRGAAAWRAARASPAGAPRLRRLGGPQGAIAQGQEPRRRRREQGRPCEGRYQAVGSDGGEEPEPENAEQGDEGPRMVKPGLPGAQVAVAVEVEGDFPSGQYGEEQDGPYQGAVLAGVESLSREVAGHAVECDSHQPRRSPAEAGASAAGAVRPGWSGVRPWPLPRRPRPPRQPRALRMAASAAWRVRRH